ncbi:MAG TPA: BsuPI-related putative proteinase inhibitor [Steroidobacteraceae bacterium]|jgi:hypothetical protein|nr:BsuPI-related putative proteinase inhibitor [Steroidobacteraceae bacterium]
MPDPFPESGNGPTLTTTLVMRNSAGAETYRFGRGEIIYFELTVLNRTHSVVKGSVGHEPSSDYLVYESDGNTLSWQWAEGKVTTAEAYSVTLQPGESKTFGVNWNQEMRNGRTLVPGIYQARGIAKFISEPRDLLTADDLRSALKEFRVD